MWSTPITLYGGQSVYFAQVIPTGATAVAAGNGYSMVLRQDGSVWGMGRNAYGQLGDGTKDRKGMFSFVQVITDAKDVVAGGSHSMVHQ